MTTEQIVYAVIGLYAIIVSAAAGGYVSSQKRRDFLVGLLFGLFRGPFGIVTVACLSDGGQQREEAGTLLAAMERKRIHDALADMQSPKKGGGK